MSASSYAAHAIYLSLTENKSLRADIYTLTEDAAVVEFIRVFDNHINSALNDYFIEEQLIDFLEDIQVNQKMIVEYVYLKDSTEADVNALEFKMHDKYVVSFADVISISELAYAYYRHLRFLSDDVLI